MGFLNQDAAVGDKQVSVYQNSLQTSRRFITGHDFCHAETSHKNPRALQDAEKVLRQRNSR
jgi:hypothetical protein